MTDFNRLPCQWPGCRGRAKVAFWGCIRHWYRIPLALRMRLVRAFRVGQELELDGGDDHYRAADRQIREWIDRSEQTARKAA